MPAKNKLEVTLATCQDSKTGVKTFVSNIIFHDSINRAKMLCIREIQKSQARLGIFQTVAFFHPDAYAEMVDSICALMYYAMYFGTLNRNGWRLQGLSPGKVVALLEGVRVPVRIYDILIAALSPVLIHENLFIPSPCNVKCIDRNLSENVIAFGVQLGFVTDIRLRFGIPLRAGHIAFLSSQPGTAIPLQLMDEEFIRPVFRPIAFVKPKTTNSYNLLPKDRKVDFKMTATKVKTPCPNGPKPINELVDRFDELMVDYPVYHPFNDFNQLNYFVPYPYSNLDESTLEYQVAVYLSLTWPSTYDMTFGDPSRLAPGADIHDGDDFISSLCFGMSTSIYNSYTTMYSLRTLRAREAWQPPRVYDFANLEDNILYVLMKAWEKYNFPCLTQSEDCPMPDLGIRLESPIFPHFANWNRKIRNHIYVANGPKVGIDVEKTYKKNEDKKIKIDEPGPPDPDPVGS